jgi:cystathionine beta-lyase/cystathionine gamma-synthase
MRISPDDVAICIEDEQPQPGGPPVPMATPIVQTSLFAFPDFQALLDGLAAEHEHHVYTRGRNPTVELLESKLARLEHGEACTCFASGMAAVSAVLVGVLRAGDHVLFVNHTYGPTLQLAAQLRRFGIEHDLLLDTRPDAVRTALRPNTRLVWMESPGTMLFRLLDIEAIVQLARQHGALTCIDNSWATPLLQKPIDAGIDFVVHSATKYIGGHSDVVAGAVIGTAERMRDIFQRSYMLLGGILAPFDAWLLLRGLRTLPVRLRQHGADALAVAEYLRAHDRVARVFHPVYERLPEATSSSTLTGHSGVFSFEIDGAGFEQVRAFIDALRRFRIGVSWGGVESIVIAPNRGTNTADLDAQRIPHGLVRLSVGLEGADVLIEDLRQAFDALDGAPS